MRFDDEETTTSERLVRYILSFINLVLTSTILFLGVNYVILPIVAASAAGLSFFHSVCISCYLLVHYGLSHQLEDFSVRHT